MMKILMKSDNPEFLVITPLKPGDKISKETKKSVKRNNFPFDWISFEGSNNIPTNTTHALQRYEEEYSRTRMLIKIDNDINMDRYLLDNLCGSLIRANLSSVGRYGYTYCPFSYILDDGRKISFGEEFNTNKLLQQNYISSNSMIDRQMLDFVGGFVCDCRYERLLDWAFWLRCLNFGFIGKYVSHKGFVTPLNKNNVSARGVEDYKIKAQRIKEDFVEPILERASS